MLSRFLDSFEGADQADIDASKGKIMALRASIKYLVQHKIVPGDYAPKKAVEALVKKYELDKKK